MTDQELLQQAKDQVAKAWIKKHMNHTYTGKDAWHQMRLAGGSEIAGLEKAACLAIQSAREEAFKEGYENRKKYGHLHDCSEAAKSTTKLTDYPECHRCGEPCAGTYEIKGIKFPTCYSCARGLSDD